MGNDINRATALNDTITLSSAGQDTITLSSVTAPVYQVDTIDLSMLSNTVTGSPYTVTTSTCPNTVVGGGFTMGTTYTPPWLTQSNVAPKINLDGEGADIEINGISLLTTMQEIQSRLNLLQPNTALEDEWQELYALGKKYRELEQQIKDKQATWDRLKAMPPPAID
jgi:hypothetical protein